MARSGNSSGALLSKAESLKLLDIIFNTKEHPKLSESY